MMEQTARMNHAQHRAAVFQTGFLDLDIWGTAPAVLGGGEGADLERCQGWRQREDDQTQTEEGEKGMSAHPGSGKTGLDPSSEEGGALNSLAPDTLLTHSVRPTIKITYWYYSLTCVRYHFCKKTRFLLKNLKMLHRYSIDWVHIVQMVWLFSFVLLIRNFASSPFTHSYSLYRCSWFVCDLFVVSRDL